MFWSLAPRELVKAFLPATVAAELEFDSVSPPPDTIEEEDEGQLPISCDKPQYPTSLLKQLKTGNKLEGRKILLANGNKTQP